MYESLPPLLLEDLCPRYCSSKKGFSSSSSRVFVVFLKDLRAGVFMSPLRRHEKQADKGLLPLRKCPRNEVVCRQSKVLATGLFAQPETPRVNSLTLLISTSCF